MMKEPHLMSAVTVTIMYDDEADVWVAENDEIGLALESESYDKLIKRVCEAVPELLEVNHIKGYNTVEFDTLPYTEAVAL